MVGPEAEKSELVRHCCRLFLIDELYEKGKALSAASLFEIDNVIDPSEIRQWISSVIDTTYDNNRLEGKRRLFIDSW